MFYRVYLKNDGNTYRGIDPNKISEGLIKAKKDNNQIFYNPENGILLQKDVNGSEVKIMSYSCDSIPGDPTFKIYFFPDFEKLALDEILKVEEVKEVKEVKAKKVKNASK